MFVKLPTILVVEDEPSLRFAYQELLPILGFQVVIAATGQDAIVVAQNPDQPLDGVLVDWDLPDMRGTQAIIGIRVHRPTLSVVMCTGAITPECRQEVQQLPNVVLMQKGSGVDKLRAALMTLVTASD